MAEYMKQCLLHPVFVSAPHDTLYMPVCLTPPQGYYMQGDVFGARGDFITSPEISQVFGEVHT